MCETKINADNAAAAGMSKTVTNAMLHRMRYINILYEKGYVMGEEFSRQEARDLLTEFNKDRFYLKTRTVRRRCYALFFKRTRL